MEFSVKLGNFPIMIDSVRDQNSHFYFDCIKKTMLIWYWWDEIGYIFFDFL